MRKNYYIVVVFALLMALYFIFYVFWLQNFKSRMFLKFVKFICNIEVDSGFDVSTVREKLGKGYILYEPKEPHHDMVIVEIHGGAFIGGSTKIHRNYMKAVAQKTLLPVFSIEYDLAPERKFPQTLDQIDIILNAIPEETEIILFGDSAGVTQILLLLFCTFNETFIKVLGKKYKQRKYRGVVSVCGYMDTQLSNLNTSNFKFIYSLLINQYMNSESEAVFFNPINLLKLLDKLSLDCLFTDSEYNSFGDALLEANWDLFSKKNNLIFYSNKSLIHNFHFLMKDPESEHFFQQLVEWLKKQHGRR